MGVAERKAKEKHIRRNDIIDAAEELFDEKGYEHATMDDVAKKAEFTKKTIYTYFASKEEIYFEIMLRAFETLNRMVDDAFLQNKVKGALEKISLLGRTYVDFNIEHPFYYRAIMDYENKEFDFQDDFQNELVQKCYASGQYSIELLESFIREGVEENEVIESPDPKILSLVLWSSMAGLLGLINRKEKYIKTYFNSDTDTVLEDGFKIIVNSIKNYKDQ